MDMRAPGTVTVVAAVGKVTFREILRERVLYNILMCALILFGIGLLASRLMVTRQERVMLDFGVSALVISCSLLAVLSGAGMIAREFERRTAFVAFSRPISRFQFVLGKYAGLAAVLAVNWVLLTASLVAILWVAFGAPSFFATSAFAWAAAFALLESLALGSLAVLFSSFSTTGLSVIITLGLYLVGSNASQVDMVVDRTRNPAARAALATLAAVVPDFEHFSLGTRVAYGLPVGAHLAAAGVLYGILLIAVALTGAGLLIRWREA